MLRAIKTQPFQTAVICYLAGMSTVQEIEALKPKIAAQMFFNWFETRELPEPIESAEDFDKWFDISFDRVILDMSDKPLRYLSADVET